MNKIYWRFFKFLALIFVISVSGLALHIHQESAGFDPLKEIQRLKSENRRDDALDMVKFFKENEQANTDEIKSLEMDLEYSTAEKIKSLVWNGSFKGEVFDTYSGLGAISSDLILFGDFRDLAIQSWKYLSNDSDYDKTTMFLSGTGIGLSGTSFINGTNALGKNTIKYIEKFPSLAEKGIIKKFLSGKVSPKDSEKIYDLLKKNEWSIPRTTNCLASFNHINHLDTVSDLIKLHKRTGNAFVNILGDNGLTLYKSTSERFRASLVSAFKRNPKALLGLTKSHLVIHTIKIFDKHGLLSLLVPLTGFSLIVSYLPQWFIWFIFVGSSVWLVNLINREFKPKTYTKRRLEKC